MAGRNVVHATKKSQLWAGVLTAFPYILTASRRTEDELVPVMLEREYLAATPLTDELVRAYVNLENVLFCNVMPYERFQLWQAALQKCCRSERVEVDEQVRSFARHYAIDSSGFAPCFHLFSNGFRGEQHVAVPVPLQHWILLQEGSLCRPLLKALKMEEKRLTTPVDHEVALMTLLAIDNGLARRRKDGLPIYRKAREALSKMDVDILPFAENMRKCVETMYLTYTRQTKLERFCEKLKFTCNGGSEASWGKHARKIRRSDEELRTADEKDTLVDSIVYKHGFIAGERSWGNPPDGTDLYILKANHPLAPILFKRPIIVADLISRSDVTPAKSSSQTLAS